jgi:hypothetical protein
MIGLSLHITNSSTLSASRQYNAITTAYSARALADGFTVEALDCVNEFILSIFSEYNQITTAYGTRVLAGGFTVEALDCVDSITDTFN